VSNKGIEVDPKETDNFMMYCDASRVGWRSVFIQIGKVITYA